MSSNLTASAKFMWGNLPKYTEVLCVRDNNVIPPRQLNSSIREREKLFIVYWKDTVGKDCEKEFDGLTSALTWSKGINHFVTIKGNGNEIVGKFGADSVEDGILPNGDVYTWKKRRR